jgi:kynureninase
MSAPRFTEDWLGREVWPRFSRVRARAGIYLANHSLGRPPDAMAAGLAAAVDAWYRDLDGAWDTWLAGRERFRALVARLVGAPRPDCIVPKASAGAGLRAVLGALPGRLRVVASDGEFDSIDFILRAWRQRRRIALKIQPWRQLTAEGADLVVLSTVMFASGEIVPDLAGRIAAAHRAGAMVLLDVYHHAGALPLDLAALDADFAIGGCYKYLRGGPGAAWLYLRPDHAESLRSLDTGWFAQEAPFAWTRSQTTPNRPRYGPGGDAWLESTPPALAPFQALAGLEFTLELGVDKLRAHNLWQKQTLAAQLARHGVKARGTDADHGAFLTLPHPEAPRLARALKARGVTVDARGQLLRLGPDILNSEAELAEAARTLGELLATPG